MPRNSYHYVKRSFTINGKRYVVRGKNAEEAERKRLSLKEAIEQGISVSSGYISVDTWFAEWVSTYKRSSDITDKSYRLYYEKYYRYISPQIGSLRLSDVQDVQLQKILNSQSGMSYSHCSKLRMVMQEMFRQAHRSRLIPFDPSDGLTLPKNSKNTHRPITDEERSAILKAAKVHEAGLWILFMLYAGLRPGEVSALTWKDIDFKTNEINVDKAVESGSIRIKETKTPAGIRQIPIHRELRRRLKASCGNPDDLIFPSKSGRPRNGSSRHRLWKSFLKEVEKQMGHPPAEDLTAYCLRHTFCTDLERAGVPINVAKVLMGHASIAVTANIYTHRDQEVLHRSMELLSGHRAKSKKQDD